MLNVSRDVILGAAELSGRHGTDDRRLPGPASVLAAIRRQKWLSLGLVFGCVALGWFFAVTSTPLFTATSEILIDGRRSHANEGTTSNRSLAELGMDPASIESQVAILGSEKNAIDTIKALHLDRDPELTTPTTIFGSVVRTVKRMLGRDRAGLLVDGIPSDVLEGFMKRLDVKRVQQSYVLTLSFSATTPERAATIANTLTNNYVKAQIEGVLESRTLSTDWVKERLASLRSDIAAAEQSVRSARAELASAAAKQSNGWSGSMLPPGTDQIRGLERTLEDKRALYAALVDRSSVMLQQQSLPTSDASVLKVARPPERKSQPNILLITILSLIAGLAAACGVAVWREMTDATFRTPGQLRDALGLRLLASMPRRTDDTRILAATDARPEWAVAQTGSIVSALETSPHGALRVVGVASSIEGENSTLVARSLAANAAAAGLRTLFVSADTSISAGDMKAISHDEALGLDTTAIRKPSMTMSGAVVGRREIETLEAEVGGDYDLLVLNLPPLSALKDSSAAPCLDALVLVIAWGQTERAIVAEALQAAPTMANRVIGAVFTGADARDLRHYARDPVDRFHSACTQHANV